MCIYMHERPSAVSVCVCGNSSNMSFLDIKDPAKRTAIVDEYVKAMKTVRRGNMLNRELQTLLHPIVSATKQAAEKTVEELPPVKKALEDIDGTLKYQQRTIARPPPPPSPPQKDFTLVYMQQVMDEMLWGTV